LILSCVWEKNPDPDPGPGGGDIDYTNYTTSWSIRVRNDTAENLVAFKGSLAPDRLIGGIPAHASQHGLEKKPALFTTNEDFPLILITEAQYNANKDNLIALTNTPFTRVFAFYNAQGTNETLFHISGHLGGTNKLIIQNPGSMNVELRLNGINGETIGYAAAGMFNTELYLADGDYLIFPVFKKYNAIRDTVANVYPKRADGNAKYEFKSFGEGVTEMTFNSQTFIAGLTLSTGTAWLIIDNQSDTGAQLQKGGVIQRTATGLAGINNGFSRTFQIDMAEIPIGTNGEKKYAATANIGAYTVGTPGTQLTIGGGNFEVAADKIYKITVTGSDNGSTLAISAPIEQSGTLSLADFN
jgi:hypothetical protein